MAAAALVGAGVGDAVSKLSDAIIHVIKKTSQFKSNLIQIQETITRNKPIFDEIEKLIEALDRPKQEKEMFIAQLKGAEALVLKCEHIKWNFYKKYTHALKLHELNASLLRFCQIDLQLVMTRGILELLVAKDVQMRMMQGDEGRWSSGAPLLKGVVIGFDDRVRDLKAMVLKDIAGDECSVVVVSAAGGCGKTTLATMLCNDPDIQAKFGRNIYFATISATPNLKIVVKNLLPNQVGQKLDFNNDDDAINQWGSFLRENKSETLLVLDDVWTDSIIKLFKFKSHGYKILATSRFTFKQFKTYQLQLLNHQDATNLFRHSAFSECESEDTDIPDDIVDKLVKCCKQHPLALSVIGGLLKGTDITSWHIMLKNLSDGQKSVLDLDESIPLCLARSLDVFKEESVIKQCFLDLGLFPEDQKIAATMLMDMWVHLYKDDVDGLATMNHLFELSYKNLATLLPIRKHSPVIANYCEEKAVMQHDLMRTLSIRLSSQEPVEHRKRLIINANGQDLPRLPHTINARLLSISTDERFSLRWNDIRAPNVEVFVLNTMSKIYPLPPFMQNMEPLNILIITNYGYHFSVLQNFPAPQYLSSLTSIRLEHVSISSVSTSILGLMHLQKLSLIMCKIGNSFTEYIPNKLPSILEIEIDSCDDLITFPAMLCSLVGLKKLSITNCLELSSLSEEFGKNLTNLEVLRLASCSNLVGLPESIRNLQKLSVIDISDCLNLHDLPAEIGELGSLRTIHMRGCTGLRELPLSVKSLCPLEVVCDEEISLLWSDLKDVKVQLVEEDRFSTFLKITKYYL
ncbi:hypothetical protein L2E82_20910 [Cichorium intybus]|uniref:Uncharacterized protein n=1 Tax=Cichorium intybus TaxID=13427 RepID=A0ACB9DUZ2_CICIN|nr:hypothetical protein L2E82_20910 [Cichorium intybus]